MLKARCAVMRSKVEGPAKLMQSQHSSCLHRFSMRSWQARHLSRLQYVRHRRRRAPWRRQPAGQLPAAHGHCWQSAHAVRAPMWSPSGKLQAVELHGKSSHLRPSAGAVRVQAAEQFSNLVKNPSSSAVTEAPEPGAAGLPA